MSFRHVTWHLRHLALHTMHGHLPLHLHTSHTGLHLPCRPSWYHENLHVWMELLMLLLLLLLLAAALTIGTLTSDSSHLALHHVLRNHHILHGLVDIATTIACTSTLGIGGGTATARIALAGAASSSLPSSSSMRHHLTVLSSLRRLRGLTVHGEGDHRAIWGHTR